MRLIEVKGEALHGICNLNMALIWWRYAVSVSQFVGAS